MYVNDAIGFKMIPEQVYIIPRIVLGLLMLIVFRNGLLRIHDLKTGEIQHTWSKLEIYAALFVWKYKIKTADIEMELEFTRVMKSYTTIRQQWIFYRLWIKSSLLTR